MKKVYKVENLDCANCAQKLEDKLNKVKGVNDFKFRFMMQKITLEINDENVEEILNDVLKTCKKVEPDMKVLVK